MKMTLLAGVAVACLALSGCAGLSALGGGDVGKQVLTNLEGCDRHYSGAIGAGVNGSFEITCKAQVPSAPLQVGSVVPPGDPSTIPRP